MVRSCDLCQLSNPLQVFMNQERFKWIQIKPDWSSVWCFIGVEYTYPWWFAIWREIWTEIANIFAGVLNEIFFEHGSVEEVLLGWPYFLSWTYHSFCMLAFPFNSSTVIGPSTHLTLPPFHSDKCNIYQIFVSKAIYRGIYFHCYWVQLWTYQLYCINRMAEIYSVKTFQL